MWRRMTDFNEHDLRYEGWRVASASAVSLFFASVLVYSFAIFFKPLSTEFSWSREVVSTAYAVMALTAAVSSPIVGYILDRIPVRRVVTPGMAVVGCGFASLALLTPSLVQFYGTFLVLGIFATSLSPIAYSRAISTWFLQRRGLALGVVIGGGAAAAIVQPPLTQAMVDGVGWRGSYVVVGLAMLVIGCPVAAFIRERTSVGPKETGRAAGFTVGEGLRSRTLWTLIAVLFASSIVLNGAIVHLSALLTDRGLSETAASLVISVMGAAGLAGRLTTGWLLDRFYGARVSFVLLSLAAIGTYFVATADSFLTGALASALIGFGMGGEMDVTPYLLSRYFGLRSFSTLYGLAYGASALAGAIGPILLGREFDTTGSYEALLPKLALFMFVVALLMLTLPRYTLRTDMQSVNVGATDRSSLV
jgi:MFS family permease